MKAKNRGTIFIAPPGVRDKRAVLFQEIVSLYPGDDYSEVLYLTPNVLVQTEAERQFFSYLKRSHKKTVYIPFQASTIRHLAAYLNEVYCKKEIIPDRIRPLLLCEILGDKNTGYACILSEFIKKIRHYLLNRDLSWLKEEIKGQIFEEKAVNRAVKALEVLERYEEELNRRGLTDTEGMLLKGLSLIKEHLSPAMLVIDGFFDPTPLELKIILALIDKSAETRILVEEGSELFQCLRSQTAMTTERLRPSVQREGTGYYSYPSVEEEVEGMARTIKGLILEGMRPWEITVTFPSLSRYIPMVRRVFRKHDIPVSLWEYDLSSTRPFIALEELITCMEEDYPRNDFISIVTSSYFPAIPEIVREWVVLYAYRAGVIRGKDSWLSIKETLLSTVEDEIPEGDRKRINEFQKGIRWVINTIETVKRARDFSSFVDSLEDILNRFGFFESLSVLPQGDEIHARITEIFSEMRQFASLYNSQDRVSLYFKHMLKGLKGMDMNTEGVRIVPYEIVATLEPEVLFFGGLIEGDFPSRPDIDPLLPERVKKALGMPYLEYYINRQKQYFKRLLNVSAHEPFFSCPSAEGDKVFLPSPFLDWGRCNKSRKIDLLTEDEILVREGALRPELATDIFWNGQALTEGNISQILRQKIRHRRSFSVTDIDFYRKCPLRFYIEKVLCLEVERPPKFEVEARIWGSLVHRTMEYLFREGDVALEEMDQRLFKGLELSLRQCPLNEFWAKVALEIFYRLLPMIKRQEAEIRKEGFSPYMVEKTVEAEINGIRLKGKIDRIDRIKEPPTRQAVILLDYKTGLPDRESLQLPLYAVLWQKRYPDQVVKTGFYSLRDGTVSWYPKGLEMDEFMQGALQIAEELVRDMKKGLFPPSPLKDEECRYCYHSPLCREAK